MWPEVQFRRLIETRDELKEPFGDKKADQAAPLWATAQAQAAAVLGARRPVGGFVGKAWIAAKTLQNQ